MEAAGPPEHPVVIVLNLEGIREDTEGVVVTIALAVAAAVVLAWVTEAVPDRVSGPPAVVVVVVVVVVECRTAIRVR